ncbi:putative succinate dehydrogenase (quinone) [Rosa chinensis]|uniref:Putative succinate dehydrogenase (Quinone) n=1 Tax=Rosa chinensis TaxID=74649 RepID=A0A2P6PUQ9_ROSCH|nr:uncharacterized protein LOC121050071 [Rosa chinensis]PRQ25670.1 putative succinate dehydrogenase (quinone) [Rosa chinensis]
MGKLKGGGKPPSDDPHVSGELSHLEFELQVHRDETSARLDAMQASLHDSMATTLASFKALLMDEFKQQLSNFTKESSGTQPQSTPLIPSSTAIPQPDGSVKFGSLSSPIDHLVPVPTTEESSSVVVRSEGNFAHLPLVTSSSYSNANDVILYTTNPMTTQAVNMHMNAIAPNYGEKDKGVVPNMLGLKSVGNIYCDIPPQFDTVCHGAPLQFPQSGTACPASHASSLVLQDNNPFVMTYSGPYSITMHHVPSKPPPLSSSHNQSQAKGTSPFISTNALPTMTSPFIGTNALHTMATTTTTHMFHPPPYFSHVSTPFYQPNFPVQMGHPHPQFQNHLFQPPHVDPNLPTMKQMLLEFSVYGGGDPVEWLNKADQYFEFYQIPEDRKLSIATMHLTDKAYDRWYMFRHEFPNTWQGLADLLMREFSGYNRSKYQAALVRMNQTGSVELYKEQFTKLSRRCPGFPPEVLLSCFIGGLKEDIRVDVQAQKPRSLYEACELARVYETRNEGHRNSLKGCHSHSTHKATVTPYSPNAHKSTSINHQAKSTGPVFTSRAGHTSSGSRKLSEAEYEARRARNQCFFCEEPYKPRQNCRKKGQLMVMEIVPAESELADPTDDTQLLEVPPIIDLDEPLIRLQVMGDNHSKAATMQVKGRFHGRTVHVLINSGATHNFIHPHLLRGTKVHVHHLPPLNVILASGAKMKTQGEATIDLQLQQFQFTDEFYILPVTGCEIVLGAGWLRSLGDILWNFDTMRMRFTVNGSEFQLQGETITEATVINCKAMTRLLRKEKEAMLVQVQPILQSQEVLVQDPQIQALIHKYEELFTTPSTLPPTRTQDHRIELLPNTSPVSVRPYRYPHFQKT